MKITNTEHFSKDRTKKRCGLRLFAHNSKCQAFEEHLALNKLFYKLLGKTALTILTLKALIAKAEQPE